MIVSVEVGDGVTAIAGFFGRISADHGLAVTAGDVENIGRLAKTGDMPAQGGNDSLPLFDRQPEMACARGKIGMVQIIGLDTVFDEAAHQVGQNRRIIVDALQKNGLADHGYAGIDQPCAGVSGSIAEFAGVIGMQGDIGGFAARLQCFDQWRVNAVGIDNRHAGMETDDLDVRYVP